MLASSTWLGAHSVLLVGDGGTLKFQRQGGIVIPDTVTVIRGINGAMINSYHSAWAISIGYASLPADTIRMIEGLSVITTISTSSGNVGYGFRYCRNLVDCHFLGTSGDIGAFSDCENLINCRAEVVSPSSAYGFKDCHDLTNCRSKTTARTTSFAFTGCKRLVNCQGTGIRQGGASIVSEGPDDISLYATAGGGSITTGGFAFNDCSYLSNCSQYDKASSTSFLGGSNTKVDSVTVVAA